MISFEFSSERILKAADWLSLHCRLKKASAHGFEFGVVRGHSGQFAQHPGDVEKIKSKQSPVHTTQPSFHCAATLLVSSLQSLDR